jgi:hypothetical protein
MGFERRFEGLNVVLQVVLMHTLFTHRMFFYQTQA